MELSSEEDDAGKKDQTGDEDDFSLKLSDEEGKSKSDSEIKNLTYVTPAFNTLHADDENPYETSDTISKVTCETSTLMLPPISSMVKSKSSLCDLTSISSSLQTASISSMAALSMNVPPDLPAKNQSFAVALTSSKKVPIDMMPTIPLVPVQLPNPRGSIVSVTKTRGRPRGLGSQFGHNRQASLSIRNRLRGKKFGTFLSRGGRKLVHSMSLDDRRILGLKDDSYLLEEEINYAHDDMSLMPSYQEKWPGKLCAFCCLAENSQLGQGEMLRYNSTPGFSHEKYEGNDSFDDGPVAKKFKTSISFREKYKYRKPYGEALTDFTEELSLVGFSERPKLASIFTDTGQCVAHYMCALWSSGIELAADDTIACVDKAIVIAVDKKCLHCRKFGASIPCTVPDCLHWYHFPCATAAGAFMDLKSIAMVCQPHALKAKDYLVDMCCMMCERTNPESSLLFCCTCGNHYHGMCLKPAIRVTSIIRTGWQCQDCKICQICRQPADEVMCGVCDRAYHIGCARQQGLTHSRTDWKCKSCRVCGDCGSRTPGNGLSSRWHANFTVCDSCYQLRNKGLACPICKKAYRAIMQKSMAQCSICNKHVHNHCDTEGDLGTIHAKLIGDPSYEYQCLSCRMNPTARLQAANDLIQSPDADIFETESPTLTDDCLYNDDSIEQISPTKKVVSLGNQTSQYAGLSLLAGGAFTCPPQHTPSTVCTGYTSLYPKGKPFIGRRGGFYSRPRVAFNKYSMEKRQISSKARGGKTSLHTPRKGRGNSSGKGYRGYFNYTPVTLQVMENNHSNGKEEGEENKILLVNYKDQFSLLQDICAMCGSFGQDQEGRLIACAQCGQCYHPYCANVKVNRVVLEKGWRCLDCTVCEGCGERNDEARLVLCEDCDISCHIYCMTPPLDQVPAGIWKCKWCAVCQYCGITNSGVNSTWQQNYSMCGPCFSMTTCPVCEETYSEAELIIQCSNCARWLHASDDMINTEDDAERCIEKGYLCLMCRSPDSLPPHLLLSSPKRFDKEGLSKGSSVQSQLSMSLSSSVNWLSSFSPNRSDSPVEFLSKQLNPNTVHIMDGTCLSEVGMQQIENQTIILQKKTRSSKGLRARRGPSLDSTGSRELDEDDEDDEEKMDINAIQQHWVFGMKEGTLLNAREHGNPPVLPEGFYTLKGVEPGTFILRKKRYRNIKTVGIGGFQVRVRAKKDDHKAREEAEMDPQALELRRKRSKWRTKKKIKLLEKFPSYIQEAFFGRNLMDTSSLDDEKYQIDKFDEGSEEENCSTLCNTSIRLSQDEVKLIDAAKEKHELEKCKNSEDVPESASAVRQSKSLTVKSSVPAATDVANSLVIAKQFATDNPLPIRPSIQPKLEEKKPKDEKVDDFAEDDENNDAIEALFGSAGSDFLSDDLVRDLINGDMKDESDRDQIDTDEDPGKLSDLLGPGFNLEDVADLMKTLPVENNEDANQQTEQLLIAKTDNNQIHPAVSSDSIFPSNIAATTESMHDRKLPLSIQLRADNQNRVVGETVPNISASHGVPQHAISVQSYNLNFYPRQQTPMHVSYIEGNNVRCPRPIQYSKAQMPNLPPVMAAKQSDSPGGSVGIVKSRSLIPMHANKTVVSPYNSIIPTSISPVQRPVTAQLNSHVPTPYPASSYNYLESPTTSVQADIAKSTCTPNENPSLSLTLQEDEALGSKATKAAVLYANIHKPTLRSDVASNQEREKQIKRMWKNLNADERKHYTQKARENKKEYIKNKQDHQRALKSQEKDATTVGAVHSTSSSEQVDSPQITAPSQVDIGPCQLSQPRVLTNDNNPSSLLHANRIQVHNIEDGSKDPTFRSQLGINETIRSDNINDMSIISGVQCNKQRTAGSSHFTKFENTDNQNVLSKQCLPQRNMEDVYVQHRVISQPRPDILKDVLQQQHGFNQSNRPQFRHPLPPVLGNQQVRLRLSGNHGKKPQGAAIHDPRMRYIVQQPNQIQPHQIHQSPQMQLHHQQNQVELQQNQIQHHQQGQIHLQQQNQLHIQQTPFRQQHNVVQLSPQITQYTAHGVGQQCGALQQPKHLHKILNPSLPTSSNTMQCNVQQTQVVDNKHQNPQLNMNKLSNPADNSNEKKNQKNELEDLENNSDLNHMEVELLSSIDSDFKDLLEYATSEQEKCPSLGETKIPTNLFEGLCKEVSKLSEGKASTSANNAVDVVMPTTIVRKITAPAENSIVQRQKLSPPAEVSVVAQGSPGSTSRSSTPGTPVSQNPVSNSVTIGQSFNSLTSKVPLSLQVATHKSSSMIQHSTQSCSGVVTASLNLPTTVKQQQKATVATDLQSDSMRKESFNGQVANQTNLMQPEIYVPSPAPFAGRSVSQDITSNGSSISIQAGHVINHRMRFSSPQAVMIPPQNQHLRQSISYPIGQQMQNYQQHIVASDIRQDHPPPPPYSCQPSSYPKQQEQPLLIEDIIEEERREQMKQQKAIASQQQSLLQNQIPPHEGVNLIRGQFQQGQRMPVQMPSANVGYTSAAPLQRVTRPIQPDSGLHPALIQAGARPSLVTNPIAITNIKTLPPPPVPSDNPVTEVEIKQQQQYEKWLSMQMKLIMSQQKYFEDEISQVRKQRKSLNSRQRTLKKNGQELSEHDQTELDRIQKEATTVQRNLDACRKSYRQHSLVTSEYNNKKNAKQKQIIHTSPTAVIGGSQQQLMAGSPLGNANSPMYSTPQSPLLSHSPSSQHNLVMSPMVPSPALSPVHTPVPQHSPHGMTIPSPIDAGPYSPQTRIPNTNVPYPSSQTISHHLMQQRSRVLTLSPGTSSPQPSSASPHHMMVMKQGYQPNQVCQSVGAQVSLRHHYPQNTVPIRRSSGPTLSPTGAAFSPSYVPPQSPLPYIAMKPSPIQNDMRSSVPLSSPQMMLHGSDNPGIPRNAEGFDNPSTPMDVVNSSIAHIHDSVQTAFTSLSATSLANASNLNNGSTNKKQPQVEVRHGGAFGLNAPLPFDSSIVHRSFGLIGGAFTKNKWGHWQIGLKGGSPVGMDSGKINLEPEHYCPVSTDAREPLSFTENTITSVLKSSFPTDTSQSAYLLTSSLPSASVSSQYPKNSQNMVFPERNKSEIPPSSRHQAVIGIPGGGSMSSQSPIYANHAIGLPRIVKMSSSTPVSNYISLPEGLQQSIYSMDSSKAVNECISTITTGTTPVPSEDFSGSLISAPIMSTSVSSSMLNSVFNKKLQSSLAKDVNVIASIANVSNQVSNVMPSENVLNPVNNMSISANSSAPIGTTVLPSVSSLTANLQISSTENKVSSPMREETPMPGSYLSGPHNANTVSSMITKGNPSINQQHVNTLSVTSSISGVSFSPQLQQSGIKYISGNTGQSTTQTRLSTPYTLHHMPQNKVPVVLTSGNAIVPSVQIISQQSFSNSNTVSHPKYNVNTGQQPTNVVIHGNIPGQVHGNQVSHLPSLSSLNSSQLSKNQIIQSVGQYNQNVGSPGAHIIVHQHNPNSMVLASNGNQVRMVGQQVIMQQGLIRGSGVVVKSGSQVQGGVRMMMIHNAKPRTPTPPPIVRQTTPLMPPPSATRSPVPHAASPVSRVSPSPSPNIASPSPRSPLQTSPVPSPQRIVTLTPPASVIQHEKGFNHTSNIVDNGNIPSSVAGIITPAALLKDESIKEGVSPTPPNVLLKQLLQNASCSGNSVQHSGQLVLVRSSPSGNFSFNQSQLSHIASQVPHPSLAAIQKNLNEMKSNSSNMQPSTQTVTRSILQQGSISGTQVSNASMNVQVDVTELGRSDTNRQLTDAAQTPQVTSTVGSSSFPGTAVHPVVIHQTTSGNQIVKTTFPQSFAPFYATKNSTQFTEQSNTLVSQNMGKSESTVMFQTTVPPATQKNVAISTPPRQLSLSDHIESTPVKTEMCIIIPDNMSVSSAGDQTPELHTPNDSCDDPEESRKAKKRAQSQTRRKSQCKDTNKVTPVKRMRQGSRVEEDYDAFIDNLMSQLKAMPQMTVKEPSVEKNFNSCPLYSCTDSNRSNKRDNILRQLQLEGTEGSLTINGVNDYYNTQPFGDNFPLVSPAKIGQSQKQFYNQVFTPPKIELMNEESSLDFEVLALTKIMTGVKRELDSPDTVLSSSSPETVLPESPPPFRGLKLFDLDDEPIESNKDRSISPAIPLLMPIPLRTSQPVYQSFFLDDAKENKENLPDLYQSVAIKSKVGLTPALPRKDQGNVDVTLTLCSQVGQDISHVLRSLANLLNIPPPRTYKSSNMPIENVDKIEKLFKCRQSKDNIEHSIDMQSVLNGSVRFCKQCNSVVEEVMINKSLSLAHLLRENGEPIDDFMFCSKICFTQFSTAHRAIHEKSNLSHFSQSFMVKHKESFAVNSKDFALNSLRGWHNKSNTVKASQLVPFNRNIKRKFDRDDFLQSQNKRTKKYQYKFWRQDALSLPDNYEKPTQKEMNDLLFRLRITFSHSNLLDDSRQCTLCHLFGDYLADGPSRLLNYDVDKWVHLNCALWAEDVYETMNGSLMLVEMALKKSLKQMCEHCEQPGASVKCFKARCSKLYHLNCAVKEGCTFYKNKTTYCQEHINKGDKDNELSTLAVLRRVFIERDESRQIASVVHHSEMNQVLRIGSLVLISIGQLLPQHLQNFHSPYCIYPIGYKVIRIYWSMKRLNKRCAYECSIHEVNSMPEFRITVQEEGFEDVSFISRSPKGVWNKILEPIAEMRQKNDVVKLFPQYISGEDLFGLTEPAIVRILESMPGVETLLDYSCKYGSNPLFELPLAVNPSGCARAETITKGVTKRHHGIRTAVGTVKSGSNSRSAASMASFSMTYDPFVPFGKPYTHSRFFQYKKMTNEWRSTVYLARSKIQGLGLYAARDIEKNTMIIEYIGEIIREELSEVREKRYESQNRGIYMFRLDDSRVVDATVSGGLARYINHSCDPNCYTETVEIERDFKIVICSNRKISRGEELAYDYKFDEEEDHKIPCLCGTDNCRKWMN